MSQVETKFASQGPRAFKKVLVANRGEIAIRVLRTCKALGFSTVAVYSSADVDSLHVRLSDEAVLLGPPIASESYLHIGKVLAACKATGADAVHPGYGFLSENPSFASACAEAGVLFIGPSASAMLSLGNKAVAKALMKSKCPNVPLIPGYDGDDQSLPTLLKEAQRVGFPLLCKAAAGGGGKGMRVVRSIEEMEGMIESVISEAKSSFGDSRLLLERYFEDSHHIEFQIFGDHSGSVVHLGERECSVQRRYQKVVEESPSPFVTPELRSRMGAAAETIGRSCAYVGAGTVEFLVDSERNFYFLEVNTRLQVEHPITECVRGLDLVALQLHIAAGTSLSDLGVTHEALDAAPASSLAASICIPRAGHAVECRLYAEDPWNNFFPATGRLLGFHAPALPGVRFDSGVESGGEISVFYDPLLAKVITWGADREEAVRRMLAALASTLVMGVTTNRLFLIYVLQHKQFRQGPYNTAFIPTFLPAPTRAALLLDAVSQPVRRFELAVVAALADFLRRDIRRTSLAHIPQGYNGNRLVRWTQSRMSMPLVKTATAGAGAPSEAVAWLSKPQDVFYWHDSAAQPCGADPLARQSRRFLFKSEDLVRVARKALAEGPTLKPPSKQGGKRKGGKGGGGGGLEAMSLSATAGNGIATAREINVESAAMDAHAAGQLLVGSESSPVEVVLFGAVPIETAVPSLPPPAAAVSSSCVPGPSRLRKPAVVVLDVAVGARRSKYAVSLGTGSEANDDCDLDIWVHHAHPSIGCVLVRRHSRFEAAANAAAASGSQVVTAPMPCKIVSVVAVTGSKVVRKQLLIVVESMKMEMRINAEADGVFTALVKAGEIVKEGHKLGTIDASAST